jgi:hypothetical protein
VGREVADRAVAPIVGEALVDEEALVGDVMDREELDGRDAETGEVVDRRLRRQPSVGPAKFGGNVGMAHREPLTWVS